MVNAFAFGGTNALAGRAPGPELRVRLGDEPLDDARPHRSSIEPGQVGAGRSATSRTR